MHYAYCDQIYYVHTNIQWLSIPRPPVTTARPTFFHFHRCIYTEWSWLKCHIWDMWQGKSIMRVWFLTSEVHSSLETLPYPTRRTVFPSDFVNDTVISPGAQVVVLTYRKTRHGVSSMMNCRRSLTQNSSDIFKVSVQQTDKEEKDEVPMK